MKIRSKSRQGVLARSEVLETLEQRLMLSTYTVNTLSDDANQPAGLLTLRQAVVAANANPGDDLITFDPSMLAAGALNTITLSNGEIDLTDTTGSTTIQGPGSTA